MASPFTIPTPWVHGVPKSAVVINNELTTNIESLINKELYGVVTGLASQVIPNEVWTTVTVMIPEVSTPWDGDWTGGDTMSFIWGGVYILDWTAVWELDDTGVRGMQLLYNGNPLQPTVLPSPTITDTTNVPYFPMADGNQWRVNPADTLVLQVYQSSGGPLTLHGASLDICWASL